MNLIVAAVPQAVVGPTSSLRIPMTLVEPGAHDSELALRMRDGDEAALEVLYDRYGSLAFTLAVRILDDRLLAEDVVQECFLNVWRSADRFDPSRSSLRGWLVTIVRNRCFDKLRGRAAQPRIAGEVDIVDSPGTDDVEDAVARGLAAETVRRALNELPPDQRQTIELAYYAGLSQTQIAERVGVPLGTVKGRVRIAVGRLRERLAGLELEEQP